MALFYLIRSLLGKKVLRSWFLQGYFEEYSQRLSVEVTWLLSELDSG